VTSAAQSRDSYLAPALVVLYAAAIAYASLQPFGEWIAPIEGTPFWLFDPGPPRTTRFDTIANFAIYVPLGLFVALIPRRATVLGCLVVALAAGAALSFSLETLQWYLPPRHANWIDFVANCAGAAAGGLLGAAFSRSPFRDLAGALRDRFVLPGAIGDVGIALIALWLVAQVNPAIAPFALTFDPDPMLQPIGEAHEPDLAAALIEAAHAAFQLLGVGLFVALLVRERRHAAGTVMVLVGAALFAKGLAALYLLKPAALESWLPPGSLLGLGGGALLLAAALLLPRPMQVATCAVALLSSLLTPLLTPDLMFAAPTLTLFNWRYGHLLNFNGLTRIVLVGWPLAAAAWLFALAGKPRWGEAL
jgi:VanZ family protein